MSQKPKKDLQVEDQEKNPSIVFNQKQKKDIMSWKSWDEMMECSWLEEMENPEKWSVKDKLEKLWNLKKEYFDRLETRDYGVLAKNGLLSSLGGVGDVYWNKRKESEIRWVLMDIKKNIQSFERWMKEEMEPVLKVCWKDPELQPYAQGMLESVLIREIEDQHSALKVSSGSLSRLFNALSHQGVCDRWNGKDWEVSSMAWHGVHPLSKCVKENEYEALEKWIDHPINDVRSHLYVEYQNKVSLQADKKRKGKEKDSNFKEPSKSNEEEKEMERWRFNLMRETLKTRWNEDLSFGGVLWLLQKPATLKDQELWARAVEKFPLVFPDQSIMLSIDGRNATIDWLSQISVDRWWEAQDKLKEHELKSKVKEGSRWEWLEKESKKNENEEDWGEEKKALKERQSKFWDQPIKEVWRNVLEWERESIKNENCKDEASHGDAEQHESEANKKAMIEEEWMCNWKKHENWIQECPWLSEEEKRFGVSGVLWMNTFHDNENDQEEPIIWEDGHWKTALDLQDWQNTSEWLGHINTQQDAFNEWQPYFKNVEWEVRFKMITASEGKEKVKAMMYFMDDWLDTLQLNSDPNVCSHPYMKSFHQVRSYWDEFKILLSKQWDMKQENEKVIRRL